MGGGVWDQVASGLLRGRAYSVGVLLVFIGIAWVVWTVGPPQCASTSRYVHVMVPEGARASFDGVPVDERVDSATRQPFQFARLELGPHLLEVVAADGRAVQAVIDVEDGPGRLEVVVEVGPTGALVVY